MPLFDPARQVVVSPEHAAHAAHDFLVRCRAWGLEREIPKRLERVRAGLDPEEAAKLHAWIAWVRFVEHALGEIESGLLDPWFTEAAATEPAAPDIVDGT
jgi:hypothetical protein